MFQEMDIYEKSLVYHAAAPPGMFSIEPTKPMSTQRDLFLANFPGVAQPCLEIEKGNFLKEKISKFQIFAHQLIARRFFRQFSCFFASFSLIT